MSKIDHRAMARREELILASGGFVSDGMHNLHFGACCLRTAVPFSVEGNTECLCSGIIRGIGVGYTCKLFRAFGENIGEPHIQRHRGGVFRLVKLLSGEGELSVADPIGADLVEFVQQV